jgi:CRISPR-associated protein Cmr4
VISSPNGPAAGKYLGADRGDLYLEERIFHHDGNLPPNIIEAVKPFVRHNETKERLEQQLVILDNDDFTWFARYALAIQARNVLEKETKQSKNLWYEESLPPDTLMYSLLAERSNTPCMGAIHNLMSNNPYLQAGGNETTGMGWFALGMAGQNPPVSSSEVPEKNTQ